MAERSRQELVATAERVIENVGPRVDDRSITPGMRGYYALGVAVAQHIVSGEVDTRVARRDAIRFAYMTEGIVATVVAVEGAFDLLDSQMERLRCVVACTHAHNDCWGRTPTGGIGGDNDIPRVITAGDLLDGDELDISFTNCYLQFLNCLDDCFR